MRNVVALMTVALSMAIIAGQAVADSTASTVDGSSSVIIQPDGTITITVTRPITSGSCVPSARLKARLHPNGRWINQGKGHRTEKDNSYVWRWDWITFPYYRDGIYDWHVDISCGLGIEEGIVIVDNSDIDYPDYGDFPRSPAPPRDEDDPDDGSGDSGSTGGGWTDSGGGYTWNSGGTGDDSGGTSGGGGGTGDGTTSSTDGTSSGTSGTNGGGGNNGYGTTGLASGSSSDASDAAIKADLSGEEIEPLSVAVEDQGNGVIRLSVSRPIPHGPGGYCDLRGRMKVRLKPEGDWEYLEPDPKAPDVVGGNYVWSWDWNTCGEEFPNGSYDTHADLPCGFGTEDDDTEVSNPMVTGIIGPDLVYVNTEATFTATTSPTGDVSWTGGDTVISETTTTYVIKWTSQGQKTVTASCYCAKSAKSKTVYVLYESRLPAQNVNLAAGSSRCNIRWSSYTPNDGICYGDDFTLPAGDWTIDSLTVWAVVPVPVSPTYHLADHYTSLTLYGGTTSSLAQKSAGTFTTGTDATGNNNIVITAVPYSENEPYYQCADGTYEKVWKIDFNNLAWDVSGQTLYVFGVYGVSNVDRLWFTHAGIDLPGGNGTLYTFDINSLGSGATTVDPSPWFGGDGSDINVQLSAHLR